MLKINNDNETKKKKFNKGNKKEMMIRRISK